MKTQERKRIMLNDPKWGKIDYIHTSFMRMSFFFGGGGGGGGLQNFNDA